MKRRLVFRNRALQRLHPHLLDLPMTLRMRVYMLMLKIAKLRKLHMQRLKKHLLQSQIVLPDVLRVLHHPNAHLQCLVRTPDLHYLKVDLRSHLLHLEFPLQQQEGNHL